MIGKLLAVGLFIFVASCSSTGNIYFKTSPEFDASTYLNPQDFGYHIEMLSPGNELLNAQGDPSFRPISFKGGLVQLQKNADNPSKNPNYDQRVSVLLEVYVDTTEEITNIKVIKRSHDFVNEQAVKAVLESTPVGAAKDGKPVNSFIRIPLEFYLYGVTTTRRVRYN